jgi:chaperonin GroES
VSDFAGTTSSRSPLAADWANGVIFTSRRATGTLRKMPKTRNKAFEYVEPIGARVVVRKDQPKRETKGGIALPDKAEIPTITGRIVTISAAVERDEDTPLRQYDRIIFHPKNAIPVDFEPDNQLFVVPVDDIVAVFRRERQPPTDDE